LANEPIHFWPFNPEDFDMKISLALGLALTLGTSALVGGVPETAHAANANHSGTICKNYDAGEALDIDYLPGGTRNLNANSRYVICPLVIAATTNSSTKVHVDGYAVAGQTIYCTLYSYDNQGNFLGSQSSSAQTGTFDVKLKVSTNSSSALSVLCLLPPSAQGVIYDIDVAQ
jgi:hypothetical protein